MLACGCALYFFLKKRKPCSDVTFAYFAVGSRTVAKARRSALSAQRVCDGHAETLLVTDLSSVVPRGSFTRVVRSGNYSHAGLEFDAFRAWSECGRLVDKHEPWTVHDENNAAVTSLRSLKTRAVRVALEQANTKHLAFLDADTLVCDVARLATDKTVGFFPIPRSRNHAPHQLKSLFGVAEDVPEANTGALVFSVEDSCSFSLADHYVRAYDTLKSARPPQLMDQVAFRAALHLSKCPYELFPSTFNCRGRDPATRAHAALACDGFAEEKSVFPRREDGGPEGSKAGREGAERIERELRGGRSCDIVHSHHLTDLSHPFKKGFVATIADPIDLALREFASSQQHPNISQNVAAEDVVDFVTRRGDAILASLLRTIGPDKDAIAPPNRADLTKIVHAMRRGEIEIIPLQKMPHPLRRLLTPAQITCLRHATALDHLLLSYSKETSA